MGQKVSPVGFRVGITEPWSSRWYVDKKQFSDFIVEDYEVRKFVAKTYAFAGISKIEIERSGETVKLILHSSRPGIVIGRKGAEVENLRGRLEEITGKKADVEIREVKKPELSAQLVAQGIAEQLTKRASFRRTMKKAMDTTMQAGALGFKVQVSGRLGGADMARRETYRAGRIPLQTLRAKVDYGYQTAVTTYGTIGVKVWVYTGDQEPLIEEAQDAVDA
jgi:small subunit ribosomal protein S3